MARELLSDSGSVFVQIGDENVHRVRALLDEVFGERNFVSQITVQTTTGFQTNYLSNISDFILWYAKDKASARPKSLMYPREHRLGEGNAKWLMMEDFTYRGVTAQERRGESPIPEGSRPYAPDNLISQGRAAERQPFSFQGNLYEPWDRNAHWKANYPCGMERLKSWPNPRRRKLDSLCPLPYGLQLGDLRKYMDRYRLRTSQMTRSTSQTNTKIVERCLLMATDPGDLVLIPLAAQEPPHMLRSNGDGAGLRLTPPESLR